MIVFAFDATTNLPKTGDAANITAYVSKDYGSVTVLGDTSATEMDATNAKGYYLFDLTQSETNADTLLFSAKSSTANIVVIGVPAVVFTTPANFSAEAISSAGGVTLADGVAHGGTLGSSTATLALSRMSVVSQSSNTAALTVTGNGSGDAALLTGGATGNAMEWVGGGTSGDGLKVTTTSGHGFNIAATGTSKHGITATGGNGGTSDGIKGAAGTGGVDIRGNITGNVTGNLSGSVGSVTGAVGSVTGNVGGNVVGSVGSVAGNVTGSVNSVATGVTVTTNNDKTGYSLSQSFPSNFSSMSIDANGRVKIQAGTIKNVALSAFAFVMTDATTHAPKTGLTVTAQRSLDGAAFGNCANSVVEVASGVYVIDLAATDTNANVYTLRFSATGADDRLVTIVNAA